MQVQRGLDESMVKAFETRISELKEDPVGIPASTPWTLPR